ncbi:MAG: T9SS type A sorting domain-containing protein, partial [Ignavibacteriaceae bacterium]
GELLIDNTNKIYLYARDSLNNDFLYCYRPDGELDWQYRIGSVDLFSSPTIDSEGNIILCVKNDSLKSVVISLDYGGNETWSTIIRDDQAFLDCSIICDAEGKIYTVSEGFNGESYIHCLDSNGEILWEVFVNDISLIGSPAINSKGTIYIGGFTSTFNASHTRNLIAISEYPLEVENMVKPITYNLLQNYPNPFNPNTTIKYSIPEEGVVSLDVYDLLGSKVASLVNEHQAAGNYSVQFDASSTAGGLPSGIYIYRLTSGQFTSSKKLILLK